MKIVLLFVTISSLFGLGSVTNLQVAPAEPTHTLPVVGHPSGRALTVQNIQGNVENADVALQHTDTIYRLQ